MRKELGSNFWISADYFLGKTYDEQSILSALGFGICNSFLFSTCRQAIRFCLRDIASEQKIALIPEFTCYSVITPFLQEGFDLEFYSTDRSLHVSSSHLNKLLNECNADVLLIHPYFGFDTLIVDEEIDGRAKVIFDQTQCQYSDVLYSFADYTVSSLRKWACVFDGAVASKKGSFNQDFCFPVDKELEDRMLEASHLKSLYMEFDLGDKQSFLRLFSEGSELIRSRSSLYRMSDKSKIAQGCLDIDLLMKRRRNNFASLLDFDWTQVGKPVFSVVERNITPLYFPIYLHVERSKFQRYLADNNIYAPIIWPKPAYFDNMKLSATTQWIYQNIISIPIDQRYDCTDMDRVKQVISCYEEF